MTHHPAGPGFATLAIHAGAPAEPGFGTASALDPMISNAFENITQAAALFGLEGFGNDLTRSINPTCAVLEERIAALEAAPRRSPWLRAKRHCSSPCICCCSKATS
jgi:O-acetylhomoserine (thiol)-lyase